MMVSIHVGKYSLFLHNSIFFKPVFLEISAKPQKEQLPVNILTVDESADNHQPSLQVYGKDIRDGDILTLQPGRMLNDTIVNVLFE